MKKITSLLTFVTLLAAASSASALDGYKDRRGLLVGVNIGGGPGSANVESPSELTGLDENRQIGFQLGAELGGGMNEWITAAVGVNWWIRTVKINERSLEHHQLSFLPTLRVFVFDGFYPLLGVGLGYAAFDTERNGREVSTYRELGLAGKVGAGYEFFLNGSVAAGLEVNYTRHFYSISDFDTFNGLITIRWY